MLTAKALQQYLSDNPDIPSAAALVREGYLDEFGVPVFWEPLTEQLFIRLADGIYQVESLETVRQTSWRLQAVGAPQIKDLLNSYQQYFRRLERFFELTD